MATFDFLASEPVDEDEDEDEDDDGNVKTGDGPTVRTTTEQLLANRFQVFLATWWHSVTGSLDTLWHCCCPQRAVMCYQCSEEDHAGPGWTTSRCGLDFLWKSQSE